MLVSAIKRGGNKGSIVIRVFNVSDELSYGRIKVCRSIEDAWLVNLAEKRIRRLEVRNSEIAVSAKAKEIVTIEVCIEE